jgi:hypothetical protein
MESCWETTERDPPCSLSIIPPWISRSTRNRAPRRVQRSPTHGLRIPHRLLHWIRAFAPYLAAQFAPALLARYSRRYPSPVPTFIMPNGQLASLRHALTQFPIDSVEDAHSLYSAKSCCLFLR